MTTGLNRCHGSGIRLLANGGEASKPDFRHPKTDGDFITQTPSPKGKLMQSVSSMLWFSERVTIHQPQGRQGQQYDETMRCPWRRHCSLRSEAVKKVARQETVEKSPNPLWGNNIGLKVEAGRQRTTSLLMEVKATPPTPQQFPSPSLNRVKNLKSTGMATSCSPLKKPLKVQVKILSRERKCTVGNDESWHD